ncbi:1-deoxy-D-xylulose-5-phosphate reductoisomerase [Candidatus Woesearchaeota archaeon]|nr:1-deoxy-D-xylulose-5-phosphate reductoisomerase [Candidatus Woesearchaeota archaeon]
MKHLSILGSTGSIGTQTLDIVNNSPKEFKITGLTANKNIELLKKQIIEFKPEAVAVMDKKSADLLKEKIDIDVYSGIDGIIKIAKLNNSDTVVNALVGSIGVLPTIEAIKNKKNIALANKETLVTAGSIVMNEIKKNNVELMPIDSEHSAIFQCLNGERIEDVSKITITASGGPFRDYDLKKLEFQCLNGERIEDVSKITITASGGPFRDYDLKKLEKVTVKDALNHPTWKMGNKITIDSATLMNKGFEVIETHWLYGIDYEKIKVVVHPQSIIHSLVEFKDTSVIAQLGFPNMKIPIQYALSHPKRFISNSKQLDLMEIKNLTFEKPDFAGFPCLKYAYDSGKIGGTMPAVLNAANEIAVYAFLENKIRFLDIPKIIKKMINGHRTIKNPDLKQILDVDKKIKEETKKIIENKDY